MVTGSIRTTAAIGAWFMDIFIKLELVLVNHDVIFADTPSCDTAMI